MATTDDLLTTLIEYTRSNKNRDIMFKTIDRIPEFDGSNTPLTDVVRKIVDGSTLIDADEEKDYVQQVLTRLIGAARTSIEGKTFNTVEEIINHLKKRYAPGRDPASFLAELGRLQIQDRESLADYIGRTSTLVAKARASIKTTYRNYAENLAQMEKTALDNFIRGLPDRIFYTISPKTPGSLDEAYDLVIEEDRARRNRRQAMGYLRENDRGSSPARTTPDNQDKRNYEYGPDRRNSWEPRREQESRFQGRRDNIVVTTTEGTTSSSDYPRQARRMDYSPTTLSRVLTAGRRALNLDSSRSPPRERNTFSSYGGQENYKPREPFCLYCNQKGHAIELCRNLLRKQQEALGGLRRSRPDEGYSPTTRDSSASSVHSLNYEGGRLDAEPPGVRKNVRFREVRDENPTNPSPSAILRRPPPQESRSEPQNWKKEKDNSP